MVKVKYAVIIILIVLIIVFLMGFGAAKFRLTIYDAESQVFSKQYKLSFSTRWEIRFKHKGSFINYYNSLSDKHSALDKLDENLATDIDNALIGRNKEPISATVDWDGKDFSYTDGQHGYYIDKQQVVADIFTNYNKDFSVNLERIIIDAEPNKQQLINATKKLASFSTDYKSSSESRKHNIQLAAQRIDKTIIGAGEQFSFNSVVGARTSENGFRKAIIIENGEFVQGVGGGVCQVSTTLYNTALLAGCEIVNARQHSLPISYVPLSFDAMVSSSTDLIFKNVTDYNMYISAVADGETVSFTIYGLCLMPEYRISLRSQTVKIIPSTDYEHIPNANMLAENEWEKIIKKPKDGYVSRGYIDYYIGDQLVKSRQIREDKYLPQKGVKIVREIEKQDCPLMA